MGTVTKGKGAIYIKTLIGIAFMLRMIPMIITVDLFVRPL